MVQYTQVTRNNFIFEHGTLGDVDSRTMVGNHNNSALEI